MIKEELYKLFKMKVIFISLFFVIVIIIYSMIIYGEFGYDLSDRFIAFSEKNGEFLTGQAGYEQNKAVATKYAKEVNDIFLKQLHKDYNTSTYAEIDDFKLYNSTYSFFQDVFNIQSAHYFSKDAVWKNIDGVVRYGFSGDWDAYGHIVSNFFSVFTVFIIVFAAPLFAFERECNMTELLGTAKNGGKQLFKHKLSAVFIAVNIIMFTMLVIISIIHFSNYGFANAEVSIQCSFEKKFVSSVLKCTMGQITFCQILFSILGCNLILLVTIIVSMLSQTSLTGFAISFVITWIFSFPIVKTIVNDYVLYLLLSVLPINGLYITTLIRNVSTWNVLYSVLVIQIVLLVALYIVTKVWILKLFFTKID